MKRTLAALITVIFTATNVLFAHSIESGIWQLRQLPPAVIPAEAGIQKASYKLDSGFRRNDAIAPHRRYRRCNPLPSQHRRV